VRTLTYSVTLQRDPNEGRPIRGRGAIVSAATGCGLAFTSPQGGHLYIFNEGPRPAGAHGT
jgi:hypothetical protein